MSEAPNGQWGTEHEMRSWADASGLMEKHPPHTITAILAQHFQHNYPGTSESEAWGNASDIISRNNHNAITGILARQIQLGLESGRLS